MYSTVKMLSRLLCCLLLLENVASQACDAIRQECCRYNLDWGMVPGVTWGNTPAYAQVWHTSNGCDAVMGLANLSQCPFQCNDEFTTPLWGEAKPEFAGNRSIYGITDGTSGSGTITEILCFENDWVQAMQVSYASGRVDRGPPVSSTRKNLTLQPGEYVSEAYVHNSAVGGYFFYIYNSWMPDCCYNPIDGLALVTNLGRNFECGSRAANGDRVQLSPDNATRGPWVLTGIGASAIWPDAYLEQLSFTWAPLTLSPTTSPTTSSPTTSSPTTSPTTLVVGGLEGATVIDVVVVNGGPVNVSVPQVTVIIADAATPVSVGVFAVPPTAVISDSVENTPVTIDDVVVSSSASPVIVSHIVRVETLPDANGTKVPTVSVTNPLVLIFEIPQIVCEVLSCTFYDTTQDRWSSEGCTTNHIGGGVECVCTHLTDFAVLAFKKNSLPCLDSPMFYTTQRIFVAVYSCVGVVAVTQGARSVIGVAIKHRTPFLTIVHALIALTCLLRILSILALRDMPVPEEALNVLTALANIPPFWIFSFFILQWSPVVHAKTLQDMATESPWRKHVFVTLNMLLFILVLTLFLVFSENFIIPQSILAACWFVMGVMFFTYSCRLFRITEKAQSTSASKSRSLSIGGKIFLVGVVVLGCFFMEAVISIVAVAIDMFDASQLSVAAVAYQLANVVALCTVMVLYHKKIKQIRCTATGTKRETNPSLQLSNARSSRSSANGSRALRARQ